MANIIQLVEKGVQLFTKTHVDAVEGFEKGVQKIIDAQPKMSSKTVDVAGLKGSCTRQEINKGSYPIYMTYHLEGTMTPTSATTSRQFTLPDSYAAADSFNVVIVQVLGDAISNLRVTKDSANKFTVLFSGNNRAGLSIYITGFAN